MHFFSSIHEEVVGNLVEFRRSRALKDQASIASICLQCRYESRICRYFTFRRSRDNANKKRDTVEERNVRRIHIHKSSRWHV